MAKENKFNLVSEDHISKKAVGDGIHYRVSIIKSKWTRPDGGVNVQAQLRFPRDVIFMYDLMGKRMKLYLDAAKKIIAWRIIEGTTTLDALNSGREVNPDATNGSWSTSIIKLLNNANIKIEETRSNIPVKEYTQSDMGVLTKFWYIEL